MKKIYLTGYLLLLFIGSSFAQEMYSNKGIGFAAGTISGIGFSYREYGKSLGYQFTLGLVSSKDKTPNFSETAYNSDDESYFYVNKKGWELDGYLGVMLLKTLKEHKKARFYSFVGASVKFDRKKIYSQKYMNSNEGDATYLDSYGKVKSTIKNDDLFYIGPGLGFDFMISEYVSLAIEWPLTVSSEKKIMMYSPQIALMIRY